MQKILSYMRKAVQNYRLISDGDKICIAVSGGKDSLVMLKGLVLLRNFIGIDYQVIAVTIDPYFDGIAGDYSPVSEMCSELGIEYHVIPTQIGEIVFDVRKESNPCSLCARMRRGALYNSAEELGCNKIALGHNFDDVVETFIMNLFTEGRIGCFSPSTYLENRDINIIRPLVLAPERDVKKASRNLKIVKSRCRADGHTNRQKTKDFIAGMERQEHGFKDRIFGAMCRAGIDGWGVPE
ncbi:MAG: tRNA 2-thiocytidine(32) synthetase TtcA [Ruminococcus sp.]|nr:tRNA 2-thiocytidine(32) synthetase TtcA [Ruminococcus sp.]